MLPSEPANKTQKAPASSMVHSEACSLDDRSAERNPSHTPGQRIIPCCESAETSDSFFCQGFTGDSLFPTLFVSVKSQPHSLGQDSCATPMPQETEDSESTLSFDGESTMTFIPHDEPADSGDNPAPVASIEECKVDKCENETAPNSVVQGNIKFVDILNTKFKAPQSRMPSKGSVLPRTRCKSSFTTWNYLKSNHEVQPHHYGNTGISKYRTVDYSRTRWSQVESDNSLTSREPGPAKAAEVVDTRSANKSFVRYSSCVRHHFKQLYPTLGNTDLMRLLGDAWRSLDESEKKRFRDPNYAKQLRFFDMSYMHGKPSQ